jgi:rare lipoprotein A
MRNVVLIILFSAFSSFCYAQVPAEEGLASFYNKRFNGHRTSNGEVYRHTKLTAAHPTLPFGTDVLVTNLSNNKSVVVKINDRCSPRRIRIDLSRAAAAKIDMIAAGVQKVRIEVASDSLKNLYLASEIADSSKVGTDSLASASISADTTKDSYTIQVASVASLKNAQRLADKLNEVYEMPSKYRKIKHKRKTLYKVFVGSFTNRDDATEPLADIKKTYRTAFIIAN